MAQKTYAGKSLEVTDDGYLVDPSKWNEEIAKEMAKEEGIELTDKHFAVLKFIRENEASLTIRKVGNSGIVDIKGFYALFPGGPLKISSKIAGIRKPTSCV
ncbi:MAG: sulfur relay protein DsrC [Bacteroidetes bacterium GWF2_33_16]|nr:MAG: sulfur relay protein DsrC [Bacteroidetes bacterium GWE2_32_14]OFY04008.1 MAG: sulfur relay protein DsrC [Bacteroidetes bacterium GWF2_33_16]